MNLRNFPEIDEIIVFQNEFSPTEEVVNLDGVRVICSGENKYTLGRFLAAKEAKNSWIYTQDDDLLVHNVGKLIHEGDPNTITANLADDASSKHWNWWQTHDMSHIELGFGSIFHKDMIDIIFEWPHGASTLKRKADKVFSVMNPWEAVYAGKDDLTRLHHDGVESGRDCNSLSLRADHDALTEIAVSLSRKWKKKLAKGCTYLPTS